MISRTNALGRIRSKGEALWRNRSPRRLVVMDNGDPRLGAVVAQLQDRRLAIRVVDRDLVDTSADEVLVYVAKDPLDRLPPGLADLKTDTDRTELLRSHAEAFSIEKAAATIEAKTGVNILTTPFDRRAGYSIYADGPSTVLVVRHDRLPEALPTAIAALTNETVQLGVEPRLQRTDLEQLATLTSLPHEVVDEHYRTPGVRQFYTFDSLNDRRATFTPASARFNEEFPSDPTHDRPVFLHYHVPKTGGTTVHRQLTQSLAVRHDMLRLSGQRFGGAWTSALHLLGEQFESQHTPQIVVGHQVRSDMRALFGDRPIHEFLILRDPGSYMVSLYNFDMQSRMTKQRALPPFEEWYRQTEPDPQTRFLFGRLLGPCFDPSRFDELVARLDSMFCVAVTDSLSTLTDKLSTALGIELDADERANVAGVAFEKALADGRPLEARMRADNPLDVELHRRFSPTD